MKTDKYNKVNFWICYNSFNVESELQVNEFGWHNCQPGYSFEQSRFDYMIQFILKGKCHLTIIDGKSGNEKKYELQRGDAFIIYPNTYHRYISDADDPCGRCWISFFGSATAKCLQLCRIESDTHIVRDLQTDKLEEIFDNLRMCIGNSLGDKFRIQANFFDLMSVLSDKLINTSTFDVGNKQLIVDSVTAYVEKHISENLNINELANMFGYERTQLYRIFKNIMNMSLQQYIVTKKMNKAVSMILETNLSFVEIARQLGFENYSAFAKLFKRWVGCSPMTFKIKDKSKKE